MDTQQDKEKAAETVWLNYFNRFLCERGLISETERNRMKLRIEARASSASGRRSK